MHTTYYILLRTFRVLSATRFGRSPCIPHWCIPHYNSMHATCFFPYLCPLQMRIRSKYLQYVSDTLTTIVHSFVSMLLSVCVRLQLRWVNHHLAKFITQNPNQKFVQTTFQVQNLHLDLANSVALVILMQQVHRVALL